MRETDKKTRRCAYVSSMSRSLSLVHDIVSALLAAMLMALCAMPRRLLFMSWSSMTCSPRRLTSVESAGPAGVTGASAAPASAAPAAAAPLSKGAGSGVGALSRASRPGFDLGGPVARAGRVFSAGGGAGTFSVPDFRQSRKTLEKQRNNSSSEEMIRINRK